MLERKLDKNENKETEKKLSVNKIIGETKQNQQRE